MQQKTGRLWMVSGEFGGLCEVVPTELYSLRTLQRLTSVAENVKVRRKLKKRGNTEVRWWFLITGEETVLQNLDLESVNIENSSSWKLARTLLPASFLLSYS